MSNLTKITEVEIWLPVVGYEGYYEISNTGKVRSLDRIVKCRNVTALKKGKICNFFVRSSEYLSVSLCKDGKAKQYTLHRLLGIHFIPNPDNKPFINHINGIKTDNRLENLEWSTPKENIQHAWNNKLCTYKKSHYDSVRKEVINNDTGEIYDSIIMAARKLKTSHSTAHRCVNNKYKTNKPFNIEYYITNK